MPPWVGQLTVGCWYRISGDHPDLHLPATPPGTRYLEDNDPAKDARLNPARRPKEFLRRLLGRKPASPWHGRVGFSAITEGWNGAAFASGFGESGSMILFGGGHDDYFGSDLHTFDLHTRQWSRLSDGYLSGRAEEYGAGAYYPDAVYPDGSPLPPHTYGYVQYDPVKNHYLLFKGQSELGPDVKSTAIPHLFHLDSLTWRRGPKHPSAILSSGGWTTWDPSRRTLWGHSGDDDDGNAFIGFCPDGENEDGTFGSWGPLYPNKLRGAANHNAMQIDPVRDIIVVAGNRHDTLYAIDPRTPAREIIPLPSSGSKPLISEYAAVEYAPNLDRLIYYAAGDGADLYSITAPDGLTWSRLTAGAWRWQKVLSPHNRLDPIFDAETTSSYEVNRCHTFGRFRIATYGKIDVAILVRHVDTPVYVMKLNEYIDPSV